MKVVIIGTGNVASVIGHLLINAGYSIMQVFGRDASRAAKLAKELDALPCWEWTAINPEAGFYLVAIADRAVYQLDRHLQLKDQLIVHTAGSVSREALKNISENYGVLYPLQSLKKELAVPETIPLLVDASNDLSMSRIMEIAGRLSSRVLKAGDDERQRLHIAAILMNNFTNHLYAVAEDYCLKEQLPFNLLLPLATETAARLNILSPAKAMTGPAMRKDAVTITKHLELLQAHPLLQKLYKQLTESIGEFSQ